MPRWQDGYSGNYFRVSVSFLPNHCVKYDDCVVKSGSGVYFNLYVSLDISLIVQSTSRSFTRCRKSTYTVINGVKGN